MPPSPHPTKCELGLSDSDHIFLERMPPLWATGYHVCRDTGNPIDFLQSLADMTTDDTSTGQKVPFDSDCIDERMYPTAFQRNGAFSAESALIQNLTDSGKKFVLTQHVQVDTTDEDIVDGNVTFIQFFNSTIIGDNDTIVGMSDYIGTFNGNDRVALPDFTSASTSDWWRSQVADLLVKLGDVAGITFAHNSPFVKLYWGVGCSFAGISYIPEDIKSVFGFDTVCPEAVHSNGESHLTMHNSYPARQLEATSKSVTEDTFLFTKYFGVDVAPQGGVYGSDYFPEWANLRKSLKEVLNLGLSGFPVVSMGACGVLSYQPLNSSYTFEELCLRWYQVCKLRDHESARTLTRTL